MEPDADNPPPTDRHYMLELLQVPDGVVGAPPEGTVWPLPLDRLFTLVLPAYRTDDGRTGYRFAYTVTAVPEPATMTALALTALFLRRATRSSIGPLPELPSLLGRGQGRVGRQARQSRRCSGRAPAVRCSGRALHRPSDPNRPGTPG